MRGRSVAGSNGKQVQKRLLGVAVWVRGQPVRQEGHFGCRPENYAPEIWPQSAFRQ